MTKSFRNLILSLLLAAGLAACEGERGPAGEAGPAGAAGADGARGATGDPGEAGKDLDDLPRPYEFLKFWGKADGMAACSDDVFQKTEAFPGPAKLARIADEHRVPRGSASPTFQNLGPLSADPPVPATDKGRCSGVLFATDARPFGFGPRGTSLRSEKIKETPKRGSTVVLGNPTLTTTERQFWGGVVVIDLKGNVPEVEGMNTLVARCGVGKRPVRHPDGPAGSKRIEGKYRIGLITETENILGKDAGGSTVIKDSHPADTNLNNYEIINYTTQICIALDSVPGTVKCYVRMSVQERNAADDMKTATRKVTERMAFYKDGKLTQAMPVPYSNGLLAGVQQFSPSFPFGSGTSKYTGAVAPAEANIGPPAKLCNFFDRGVVPCLPGEVPNNAGACVQG